MAIPRSRAFLFRCCLPLLCMWAGGVVASPPTSPDPAATLLQTYRGLAEKLLQSPFGRPLVLDSSELPDGLQGDVYAVVAHPLTDMTTALDSPQRWCEALLLHVNNRRCVAVSTPGRESVTLSVVRRYDKPIDSAFTLPFVYRSLSRQADYMAVELTAEDGPLGTRNYRVMLEAIPLGASRTFLHFSYAYEHSMMARMATQAYLATFGSDKVGFTPLGRLPTGEVDWIRGTRGLVERNAMRYFLAVDAYLDALSLPAAKRRDERLRGWFASIERYPRQLREFDRETYLELKREDRARDGGP